MRFSTSSSDGRSAPINTSRETAEGTERISFWSTEDDAGNVRYGLRSKKGTEGFSINDRTLDQLSNDPNDTCRYVASPIPIEAAKSTPLADFDFVKSKVQADGSTKDETFCARLRKLRSLDDPTIPSRDYCFDVVNKETGETAQSSTYHSIEEFVNGVEGDKAMTTPVYHEMAARVRSALSALNEDVPSSLQGSFSNTSSESTAATTTVADIKSKL
ncbi:hypothetical protein IAT38_004412 [Cryptococcus sp. DSM 104549]